MSEFGEDGASLDVEKILRLAEECRRLLEEGDLDDPDTIRVLEIDDELSRLARLFRPEGCVPPYADDDPHFGHEEE